LLTGSYVRGGGDAEPIRGEFWCPPLVKLVLGLYFFKNARGDFRFVFGKNRKWAGSICHVASRETLG
jgi:hypothetical protein